MSLRDTIKKYFPALYGSAKDTDPETAYDHWASSYDSQPDNLMLALDEALFLGLLNEVDLANKIVADIGCGTGRHWPKIWDRNPAKLVGFDVSEGMLTMLQKKYPASETHQLKNNHLPGIPDNTFDIIISTLTIAHIENFEEAFMEWKRVLKPGGSVLLTDYHPIALAKGGKRTFKQGTTTISILNHIHPIDKIRSVAKQLNVDVVRLIERRIDETDRHYYEKQHALPIYEAWKGTPIIYGLCLKDKDDTT